MKNISKLLMLFLIFICLFITGCIDFKYEDSSKSNINNVPKEISLEEQIIKHIEDSISSTYKYDQVTLNKINDNTYDVFIKLRRRDKSYNNIKWMATDGMSVINSIKYYSYDEVDKIVSTYNVDYYDYYSDIIGKTIYKNDHNKKKIESVTIITANGKSQIVTSKQIDSFHEERLREEAKQKERSKYDIEVDAKTISNVYYNNKLDGNKKYFGKRIKSYGKFTSAEKGTITGWSIILNTTGRYDYYCTSFASGEEYSFSSYNRGENLIVYAEVDELIGNYIRLKNCDLEKQK